MLGAGLGLAQAQPGPEAASPRARFDGLLAVLAQDEAARRAFVEANFTPRMIEKRGVEELVQLLGVLHEDFGANRPLRVQATHEEFSALFKFTDRDEFVSFKVKFAPPDSKIAEYGELFVVDPPAAEPGEEFRYSNNGFVLLGLLAERVSDRDYFDLVRELVYAPAGMTASDHYLREHDASKRAIGYLADGAANTDKLAARGSAAGGGYASARDLLRFAKALQAGRIVRPETFARMTHVHAQMGGPQAGYGCGFGVFTEGEKHYGHNGGAPGINASFEIFPDSGYVVIVLSNVDRGANELAQKIGQAILARK